LTPSIVLTLGIIIVAIVLFATEKLRVDVIAMLVLITLALTGLVTGADVFAGFSSPAVITVWAVYIVAGGLFRTGVADYLGRQITNLAGTSEPRLIAVIMLTCGFMSAFMNNIGAVAMLLPAVAGISRQSKIPLSRLLIPLSFASLMGGNMTLIGTPPNVLAASILSERGLDSFSFFDFTPMGSIVFLTGVLFMVFIGRHLLPMRQVSEAQLSARELRQYVSEVRILPQSPLAGLSLLEARLGADYDLSVLGIVRDGRLDQALDRGTVVQSGDLLIVEGAVEKLMGLREQLGLAIEAEEKFELIQDDEDAHIFEAVLAPRSPLINTTLRRVEFRERYGFTAMAIWRQGEVITERLRDVRLRFGDVLLLKGPVHRQPALQAGNEFLVLEALQIEEPRRKKGPVAVGILALVLLLATFGGLHISLAMVIGAMLMVLSRCLTMDEAYQSIEWRSIFLIAGMLPLGVAMETTGTARLLATTMVEIAGAWGPLAILAGIYILASLVTEPMSNAAATVLIVPISIDIALALGANPQPFVLATVIGASTSFLTPVGHQANVLVLGPGGYRFFDYTRVGLPLNILIFAVTMVFLPMLWPLF
jgi:di/tricarboxylate transporter